ncbi:MAG: hypothetical protein RMJ98_20635 [Myxococcales bacterium]|nr:hypothetical protein [Polyangiaceae bacterium]MDW8251710.1 hypothetical protein [Myxococcales bacterium]
MSLTDDLLAEIRREFPRFRVVSKEVSFLSRVIDLVLKIITFGHQKDYLTHYYTVLFHTLYTPKGWENSDEIDRVIILRHERVHLRQFRRYTAPGMVFLYLVPFFPLGLAYGRARIEWEAYTETLRATAELRGLAAARSVHLREYILEQFTGGSYGWMWPFERQVSRWYDEALAQIEREVSAQTPEPTTMGKEG